MTDILEWEKHEPGYYSLALFDHREYKYIGHLLFSIITSDMPICDGVEAAKRLRLLENKRKTSVYLPGSQHHHRFDL